MKRNPLPGGHTLSAIAYAEPTPFAPDAPGAGAGPVTEALARDAARESAARLAPERRAALLAEALESGATTVLLRAPRHARRFAAVCAAAGLEPRQFEIVACCDPPAALGGADNRQREAHARERLADYSAQLPGIRGLTAALIVLPEDASGGAAADAGSGAAAGVGEMIDCLRPLTLTGAAGLICSDAASVAAAGAVERGDVSIELVVAPLNPLALGGARLAAACGARGALFYASGTFDWVAGVPFVRFPNTWRLRNMTRNFHAMSAGQAHLRAVLGRAGVAGAVIATDESGQAAENAAAYRQETPQAAPPDVEALLAEFATAVTGSIDGWLALLADERAEYRYAARRVLAANGVLPPD